MDENIQKLVEKIDKKLLATDVADPAWKDLLNKREALFDMQKTIDEAKLARDKFEQECDLAEEKQKLDAERIEIEKDKIRIENRKIDLDQDRLKEDSTRRVNEDLDRVADRALETERVNIARMEAKAKTKKSVDPNGVINAIAAILQVVTVAYVGYTQRLDKDAVRFITKL